MNRSTFDEVAQRVPLLGAEGILNEADPEFKHKRDDFLKNDTHLQEAVDASQFLAKIGKSERFSEWQRSNCTPAKVKDLLDWHTGRSIAPGSIIISALQQGFTMGVAHGNEVYFNFLAPQMETELAQLRTLQQIKGVVGEAQPS